MPQEALDFGRMYRVTDAVRAIYRHTSDAVDSLGILPAAGACGIDRGDLRRALDRDGRKLAVEHVVSIAAIAAPSFRSRILAAIVSPFDVKLVDSAPMTDKEKATRLEVALRALGPVGEQALSTALGGGGR